MFQTNVTGLIAMTQAILPIFLARPDGGRGDIINIGSIAGREPYSGGSIYCATKAAVRSFTDSLRKELIASRVRVIEIDPGQVETEFSIVRFGGDKAKADKVYEGVEPLTGDDIAEVVVFAAGRRENVVVADTLVFPNHQVCFPRYFSVSRILTWLRRRQLFCTGSRRYRYIVSIERKVKERTLIISKFQLLPDIKFLLNNRHAWCPRCYSQIPI
jgi:short-subunit dehydrogenase